MAHYIGYHSADRMGYGSEEVGCTGLYTNKPIGAVGDVIWVVVGDEGRPKSYRLRYWFVVDQIEESAEHPDFGRTLSGKQTGQLDRVLNNESWFRDFLKRMGNFGLGLSRLND